MLCVVLAQHPSLQRVSFVRFTEPLPKPTNVPSMITTAKTCSTIKKQKSLGSVEIVAPSIEKNESHNRPWIIDAKIVRRYVPATARCPSLKNLLVQFAGSIKASARAGVQRFHASDSTHFQQRFLPTFRTIPHCVFVPHPDHSVPKQWFSKMRTE